ncbi:hypothetical protein ACP70R_010528 [Stipagrostis hirtigluma subsp. patula]
MASTSWADLPVALILRVAPLFPCLPDRIRMSCLNRHWRAVVKRDEQQEPRREPRPELPWLLLPSTTDPSFYTTIGDKRFALATLPPDVRAARFCGSFGGGWLALALSHPPHAHALYNLNSGVRIDLPRLTDDGHPVTVRVATFSATPSRPPSEAYLVGAIIQGSTEPCVAFWQRWMGEWVSSGSPISGTAGEELHDIIYYRGGFHVITSTERMVVYVPQRGDDGQLSAVDTKFYDAPQREDYDEDVRIQSDVGGWMDRYLVVSRGELLMVVRYVFQTEDTQMFRVFRLDIEEPADEDHLPRASWGQFVGILEGRMLFVGHGCSRSFDVADFDEFEDSTIYFYDDRFAIAKPVMGETRYHLTDSGKFYMDDNMVAVWPQEDLGFPGASDRAPPIWWLH